jgi:hypothetical protein
VVAEEVEIHLLAVEMVAVEEELVAITMLLVFLYLLELLLL